MAGELFFDIANLDTSAVAVSREEIGALNPQCGHMRQLDYLIWANETYTDGIGVKKVMEDEFWVPGHIPGRPLLPAVLMIEAGAQLCSILYKKQTGNHKFLGFTRCDNAVFRGTVVPGDTLYILGREVELRPRRFISDAQGVVNGNLVFEVRVTGMIL